MSVAAAAPFAPAPQPPSVPLPLKAPLKEHHWHPQAFLRRHVSISHDSERHVITIEVSEDAVLASYLSGMCFLIGSVIAGCALYRRHQDQQRNTEACTCASCRGQYRIRKELGTGGYGRAHLVMRQGKPYVLKVVGCDSINEANAALTEASCLQRLNHPHVVRFEDVFLHRHDNGGCSVSIVMEFCAGGDLTDRLECRLNERPLSELTGCRFLESLCHALHHVHCCGVLHRDLKSSNIFVSRHDRDVKLGDFGLAATGLSPRRLTGSPRRMSRCGTAMYMSPEVSERKPYGAASDTYGLGCALLEILLRHQLRERRPFETRKDYITEALDAARGHGWHCFDEMANLAWRMLDDKSSTRIPLPDAAAAAASCVSTLAKLEAAADAAHGPPTTNRPEDVTALAKLGATHPGDERNRPPKRIGIEERSRRYPNAHQERRRRLQYAD